MDNIFDIPDPEDWLCKITLFTDGHKTLHIEIRPLENEKTKIYLHFGRVAYYSGCTGWKGANFRLATKEEYIRLFESINRDLEQGNDLTLYINETNRGLCQILALAGQKEDAEGVHPAPEERYFQGSNAFRSEIGTDISKALLLASTTHDTPST